VHTTPSPRRTNPAKRSPYIVIYNDAIICIFSDGQQYLDVAEELLSTEKTAVDFFNAMVERYPDRLGRTVLWATAQAVFGIREHPAEDPIQFIAGGWL